MTHRQKTQEKPRKERTAEELRGVSDRLFYEWQMLAGIAQAFEEGVDDQLIKNVLIESGAIHSRNLIDFFYGYEQKPRLRSDDMVAEDLFEEPGDWPEARGSLPDALEYDGLVFYVDKQVVHMVYPQRPKRIWDFTAIADGLQPTLEKFIGMVGHDGLGDRWKQLLEHREGSLGRRWEGLRHLIEAKVQP